MSKSFRGDWDGLERKRQKAQHRQMRQSRDRWTSAASYLTDADYGDNDYLTRPGSNKNFREYSEV